MNFVDAVKTCLTKYADYNGRARRSEYFNFLLFQCLTITVLGLLGRVFGGWGGLSAFVAVGELAFLMPSIAVSIRRLHDTGREGIMLLFFLIPLAGPIIVLVWVCQDSEPNANKFGANPKVYTPNAILVGGSQGPVKQTPQSPTPQSSTPQYSARCLAGPLQGQMFPIPSEGLLFGRDSSCRVLFPNDTPGVSQRHCLLTVEQGVPTLTDLGSSYGTILADGRKLHPMYPQAIGTNVHFYVGSQNIVFDVCLQG